MKPSEFLLQNPEDQPARSPSNDFTPKASEYLLDSNKEEKRAAESVRVGASKSAAESADVLDIVKKTGVDIGIAERNREALKAEIQAKDFNLRKFHKESPTLMKWISKRPEYYALTKDNDDLDKLSTFEKIYHNGFASFERGRLITQSSELGWESMKRRLTPKERFKLTKLQARMQAIPEYDLNIVAKAPGILAEQSHILLDIGLEGLEKGGWWAAVGAAGGGIFGGVATAGVGAGPGALAGAKVLGGYGFAFGSFLGAVKLEGGGAMNDFESIKNEDGTYLDRDVARGAALIVGVASGSLEFIGAGKISQSVPGLKNLTRSGMRNILKKATVNKATMRYLKNIGATMGTEGATEGAQELIKIMMQETLEMTASNEYKGKDVHELIRRYSERVTDKENLAAIKESTLHGTVAGGGFSAIGGTYQLSQDIQRAKKGKQDQKMFEQFGTLASDTRLMKDLPDEAKELVKELSKNVEKKDVYAPVDTWIEYWQSKGVDPSVAAEEILGEEGAKAYAEAVESGADIAIPFDVYATKIAPTEHNKFFQNELKSDPDGMNGREADDFAKEFVEIEKKATEDAKAEREKKGMMGGGTPTSIKERVQKKLERARYDKDTAEASAQLTEEAFKSIARRYGDVSAEELFDRTGLDIKRKAFDEEGDLQQDRRGTAGVYDVTDQDNYVIDPESGRPAVVYRGQPEKGFDKYKDGGTIFFTDNKEVADSFVSHPARVSLEGKKPGYILRGNIKMENPFVFNVGGAYWADINTKTKPDGYNKSIGKLLEENGFKKNEFSTYTIDDVIKMAKMLGHDGAVMHNTVGNALEGGIHTDPQVLESTVYAVFDKENFKEYGTLTKDEKYYDKFEFFQERGPKADLSKTKAVDDKGEPVTVYRGAYEAINLLKEDGEPIFFTDSKSVADTYISDDGTPADGTTMERGKLDMNSPLIIDMEGAEWVAIHEDIKIESGSRKYKTVKDLMETDDYAKGKEVISTDVLVDLVKNIPDEFDGIIIKNVIDTGDGKSNEVSNVYVVFDKKKFIRDGLIFSDKTYDEKTGEFTDDSDYKGRLKLFDKGKSDINKTKAVDDKGKPATVYRGQIDKYTPGGRLIRSLFFTNEKELAREYAKVKKEHYPGEFGGIVQGKLMMTNPIEIDAGGERWKALSPDMKVKSKGYDTIKDILIAANLDADESHSTDEIAEAAKSLGHDGVIFRNIYDTVGRNFKKNSDVFVTFNGDNFIQDEDKAELFQTRGIKANVEKVLKQTLMRDGIDKERAAVFSKMVASAYDAISSRAKMNILNFMNSYGLKIAVQEDLGNQDFEGIFSVKHMAILMRQDANPVVFFHELGHYFLDLYGKMSAEMAVDEIVDSQHGKTATKHDFAEIDKDYREILKWLGVKDRSEIKVEHHERWARAIEEYFFKGKAPNKQLEGVFHKIRIYFVEWYLEVKDIIDELIEQIKNTKGASTKHPVLKIKMNKKIEGIIDRMLAKEDKKTLFQTRKDLGKTKAVDKSGKPVKVFHGSNEKWNLKEFSKKKQKRWGVSFSSSENVAKGYMHGDKKTLTEGYLYISNLLEVTGMKSFDKVNPMRKITDGSGERRTIKELAKKHDISMAEEHIDYISEIAKFEGYDGVVYRNISDPGVLHDDEKADTWVVFHPDQFVTKDELKGRSVEDVFSGRPERPVYEERVSFKNFSVDNFDASKASVDINDDGGFRTFEDLFALNDREPLNGKDFTIEDARSLLIGMHKDLLERKFVGVDKDKLFPDHGLTKTKAVDKKGKPITVYRGQGLENKEDLDPDDIRFYTSKKKVAEKFSGQKTGGSIAYGKLLLKEPLVIDVEGSKWDEISPHIEVDNERELIDIIEEVDADVGDDFLTAMDIADAADTTGEYDGVIFENVDAGDGTVSNYYVSFEKDQFVPDEDSVELFQGDKPLGSISFGKDRQFDINLFEGADRSTFLHESGHLYLEILGDLYESEGANEKIKADYESILAWLGVSSRAEITVEHHEKWARGIEAYLMEGKAPNSALKKAFAQFRSWLLNIYGTVKNLDVELSDDVREVMDRIFAAEEQVEQAREIEKQFPMFDDLKKIGMNDSQAAAYSDSILEAREQAFNEMRDKHLAEVERERKQWWKDESAKVREEIEPEIYGDKIYIALSVMQRGKLPNGDELPDGMQPVKLNKEALLHDYGPEFLKTLPRPYMYSAKEGMHHEIAAELFGFKNAQDMFDQIIGATPVEEEIKNRVDKIMKERHGDLLQDINNMAKEEAVKSIFNDKAEQLIRKELEYLASDHFAKFKNLTKRIVRNIPTSKIVREQAMAIIADKKVRDIRPIVYQRAASKEAKRASDLFLKGEFEEAFEAKRKQLLNHHLYKEAVRAKDSVNKTVKYMKTFEKKAKRQQLGKAGADYLEQIDGILDRYSLRGGVSLKALDKQKSLIAWMKEQNEMGQAVDIPDKVLNEAKRTHYKELTLRELDDIEITIKTIDHLARTKFKLLGEKEKRDLQNAEDEIVASIMAHHEAKKQKIKFTPPTTWDNVKDFATDYFASHDKMEFVFRRLDGFKPLGVVQRYLFQPFVEAERAKSKMSIETNKRVTEIMSVYDKKEKADLFIKKINIRSIDNVMTKSNIMAVALNWGNQYNRDGLMEGYGWTESQVQEMLSHLTAKDWQVVQNIWDLVDSFWPEVEQMEKDLNGIAPPKVEATEVQTRYGTLKGGYYPIMFDAKLSWRQSQLDEAADIKEMFGGNWAKAMTKHNHTKARNDTGGKPFTLQLGGLSNHLSAVIQDLTHRRAVINVSKIVNRPRVREAIESVVGREYYKQINPWIKDIAADRTVGPSDKWEKLMRWARNGATAVNMGYKATTSIVQFTGYSVTVDEIGKDYSLIGLGEVNSFEKMQRAYKFASERSQLIANRLNDYDRDVRHSLQSKNILAPEGKLDPVHDSLYMGIGYMDLGVVLPSWMGAYRKAMDGNVENIEKGNEKDAIDYADSVIRTTQGAGTVKDLSAIQRGGDTWKTFTMFYSFFSVHHNRLKESGRRYVHDKDFPRFVASMFWLWFLPPVLEGIILGRGPEEDESWGWWLAKAYAKYPFQGVILLRDVVNIMDGYGYNPSAAYDALGTVGESAFFVGKQGVGFVTGDRDEIKRSDVKKVVLSAGYLARLPSRQMWLSGEYMYDWMTGEEQPDNVYEGVWRGMVTGKPKE